MFEFLLYLGASLLITYVITPRPAAIQQQGAKAAALEDFEFPQADEGTPQCVVFGEVWSSDWMVLGVGKFRTTEIKK